MPAMIKARLHLLTFPLAALIAVLPLLLQGPSCGHDLDFHLLSWMEAAQQISHGNLHPHWAFTPAYNAGEPRFIFYPPISWTAGALLTLLLTHLPGVSAAVGFGLAPAIYTWMVLTLAGCSCYVVVRRVADQGIAVLVSTFYLANPYMLFTAYERTAYAELLAAVWFPLLLAEVLAIEPSVVRLAIAIALLWLTNAPAAVMGCYTIVFLGFVRIALGYWSGRSQKEAGQLAMSFGGSALLGLGLAGFYLVPAIYEQRWVEIGMAILPGLRVEDNTLFHHTGDPPHDAVLQTASIVALLMLTMVVVALLGLMRQAAGNSTIEVRGSREQMSDTLPSRRGLLIRKTDVILLASLTFAIGFFLTSTSLPLWSRIPELGFLQFPWRLLAILAPVCAVAAALAVQKMRIRALPSAALASALAAIFAAPAYMTFRQGCDPSDTPVARLSLFRSGAGSEPTDEYTPAPADNDALRPGSPPFRLLADEKPDRAPKAPDLPPGPAPTHLQITAQGSRVLLLNLREFPSWKVMLNGHEVSERIERDDGLLAFRLPEGTSSIDVLTVRTPDQILGDLLSSGAVIMLMVLFVRRRRRHLLPLYPSTEQADL